jgi:uroporphyrinogen-III synthase
MRVLITRPRRDAEAFSAALHAQGHTTFVEPMIEIEPVPGAELDFAGVQAVLLTSANAARALAGRTSDRAIRILAVGAATGREARDLGFSAVAESDGEGAAGLAEFVARRLKPQDGLLVHAAADVTAGDLEAKLEARGFGVRRETIYRAHAAMALSGALSAELGGGLIDAAAFFSPRTAAIFARLVEDEGLTAACPSMVAFALSDNVAKALAPLAFRRLAVAEHPTVEAVLALIGKA